MAYLINLSKVSRCSLVGLAARMEAKAGTSGAMDPSLPSLVIILS